MSLRRGRGKKREGETEVQKTKKKNEKNDEKYRKSFLSLPTEKTDKRKGELTASFWPGALPLRVPLALHSCRGRSPAAQGEGDRES